MTRGEGNACPRNVVIIGGGFVGLHTAVLASISGVNEVIIVDINDRVVNAINKGSLHVKEDFIVKNWPLVKDKITATTDYSVTSDTRQIIVSVQTPIKEFGIDFGPLDKAVNSLSDYLKRGTLIVSEVTIYPGGTNERIADPLSKGTGLTLENDLYVAHVPERIDSGRKDWPPSKLPRVVGAIGPNSLEKTLKLYRDCFKIPVHVTSDIRVAEFSKLLENSFRLLNITFVNELKRYADQLGINMKEVIRASSTKPFGFMPFYPGPYAGGSCLPKDSRMLEMASKSNLLAVALNINSAQPEYYASKIREIILKRIGYTKRLKVTFIGAGYKPGSYIATESPVLKLYKSLREKEPEWDLTIVDPRIPEYNVPAIEKIIDESDVILLWGYDKQEISISKHSDKLFIDLTNL